MTSMTASNPHTTYEIRVGGHLDDRWSAMLGGLSLTRDDGGATVLRGPITDQAQLHGILARVRDLGVPLLSLRQAEVTAATDTPPASHPPELRRPVHTPRLTLRAATGDDTDATWAYRRLDSVGEWLTEIPADLDTYRATFTRPGRLATTVIVTLGRNPRGPIIGDFMLRREDAWAQVDVADQARDAQAELGWVLDPAYTSNGYATEAVREILRYCFQDLGVRRVTANCFLANRSSWRLMERVGMRREVHAVRESLHRSGRWLDTVGYAILAEEWSG